MDAEPKNSSWNRRMFLARLGMGTLSWAGLALLSRAKPAALAAAQPRRFVYAWTAFDILDPHVKYDTNATFFTLNMYDSLLRYQGNPPQIVPWLAESSEVTDGGKTLDLPLTPWRPVPRW
jgi:peptide/nickel transport system substrate-binding protein